MKNKIMLSIIIVTVLFLGLTQLVHFSIKKHQKATIFVYFGLYEKRKYIINNYVTI